MAKGLALVEAVLAGKRVKHGEGGWLQWDPTIGRFRREDGTAWYSSSRQLLTDEWIIEADRPLTFSDAHARMRQGAVVELPMDNGGVLQYRIRDGSYEMREGDTEGAWSAWDESMVGVDCVEATNWRVVSGAVADGRPTFAEFQAWLAKDRANNSWLIPNGIARMAQRWPAMFRKERE